MQFEQVPVNSPSAATIVAAVDQPSQKDHARDEAQRKLEWACLFCVLFMLVEFLGGYVAGSLAIMSDAAHLLSDVLSFLLSLFALYLSKYPPSSAMPFGYKRAEVLGALASIVVIWMLTLGLVWAAIQRIIELLQTPHDDDGVVVVAQVNGKVMFIVASMGLVVNIALMKILGHGHSHGGHGHSHGGHGHAHGGGQKHGAEHGHSHGGDHGHSHGTCEEGHSNEEVHEEHHHGACSHDHHDAHGNVESDLASSRATDVEEPDSESSHGGSPCAAENLNVRAAYLHALGDFLQSLGVCIAGALIWYEPSWQLCDPVVTLLFSVIVGATTIGICKTTLHVLMEGTPVELDVTAIEKAVKGLSAVQSVHDFRCWSISSSSYAVAVHVVETSDNHSKESIVLRVQDCLMALHDFEFVVVQVEGASDAKLCRFNLRQDTDVVV
ncbi:Aste57867_4338 [Aphanomyces stellatus]|uniref:Aste57867_4338 protein n=1 Tax=Aphanomyces stellatus TaxID=120398 RepID=A0A485KFQ8_9STRA|nr:hypothetical protein As57867_004327 [Aphanomyces stellatus]VFT81452.1 Aste57867_4338 [Aphanomyces stellatus]